jgi:hypothetical protein
MKLWFWSKGSCVRITTVICKLSQWIPYDGNDTPVFNEVLWYFIYQTIWWQMLVRCQNVVAKEKPSMSVHTVWLCSSNSPPPPPTDYELFQVCSIFMCAGLSRSTYVSSAGWNVFICKFENLSFILNKCCVHLQLQSTTISFKLYIFSSSYFVLWYYVIYIPQLTSKLLSLLSQFFFQTISLNNNSHVCIGALTQPLPYRISTYLLYYVLNVHWIFPVSNTFMHKQINK